MAVELPCAKPVAPACTPAPNAVVLALAKGLDAVPPAAACSPTAVDNAPTAEESPPQASAPALGFWAQAAGLGGRGTVCASVGVAAIANSAPPIMPSVDRKIFFARRRAAPEPSIGSSLVSQDKSFLLFRKNGNTAVVALARSLLVTPCQRDD